MDGLLHSLQELLPTLEECFRILERKLPAPVATRLGERTYPRYKEKTAEQAALQKSARYISGLHALVILLNHRHLQEDGTIKRTLDELGDDVWFLLTPPETQNDVAQRQRFLDSFYAEEFDPGVPTMESKRKRKRTSRREVRDYIHAHQPTLDTSGLRASQLLYQGYSGYVHADSPHLMEMWGWDLHRFELDGIKDNDLFESHVADEINYFVRGFYCVGLLALRVGETELFAALKKHGDQLADIAAKLSADP
jgi:hypothetical protein